MSIPNSSKTIEQYSEDLLKVLERMRITLNLSPKEWAERLLLTKKGYDKIVSRTDDLPLHSLIELSDKYNVSLELIKENSINYDALLAHSKGDFNYLPDKYKVAAYSKNTTALIQLDYIEKYFGWHGRQELVKHFQVNENVFNNPDMNINLKFYQDFSDYMEKRFHLNGNHFESMGAYSLNFNKSTPLGKEFSKVQHPHEIFIRMFDDLQSVYEKNCDYKIHSLNKSQCVVDCYSRSEVAEALKVKYLGSENLCAWKRGVFVSAPGYLNLPFGKATEVSCVHRGDSKCRFVVTFDEAHQKFKRLSQYHYQ